MTSIVYAVNCFKVKRQSNITPPLLCLNTNGWKPIVLGSWFHMHKEVQLGNVLERNVEFANLIVEDIC
jgi:hypothetical protein